MNADIIVVDFVARERRDLEAIPALPVLGPAETLSPLLDDFRDADAEKRAS